MFQSIEKNTYILSIIGVEKGDFAYYLASILNSMGKSVMVIDNSYMSDLYDCLKRPDDTDDSEVVQQGDVTFLKKRDISPKVSEKYDFVIVNHGMQIYGHIMKLSDYITIVSNFEPRYKKNIINRLKGLEATADLVLRDKLNGKISEEKILNDFSSNTSINVEDVYSFPYEEKDASLGQALAVNGHQKYTALSKEYRRVLSKIISKLTNTEYKTVSKYTKV